jgi:hypothetical protein
VFSSIYPFLVVDQENEEPPKVGKVIPPLGLLTNAYDFVNESIVNAVAAANGNTRGWKFAIINAANAIELMLKERLRREHPLLVWMNVDKPQRLTVGAEQALERLAHCQVALEPEDVRRLRRARDLRNTFVHFETNLEEEQMRRAYVDLFEFAHTFHLGELGAELHDFIDPSQWTAEAQLMEEFRRDFVVYQGRKMIKQFPAELLDAQFVLAYKIAGKLYPRVRWGDESIWQREGSPRRNCRDCGALERQMHVLDCCVEECPKCGHQFMSCPCEVEDSEEVDELPDQLPWLGGTGPRDGD